MTTAPEPRRSSWGPQIATTAITVAAFVTGAIGMATSPSPPGVLDTIYRCIQLFVLDGAAIDGLRPLNGWIELARFLAPSATGLAVVLTLRRLVDEQWRRRSIAATRGHAIVCGDSDAAVALARNLRETGRTVVLVGSAGAEAPAREGILAVPGDPREPVILRAAGIGGATALYACASRSAANAAVALAAGRLRTDPGARLSTFAQVRSEDLVEALRVRRLRAAQPDAVTMDFFALDDIAARILMARHAPDPASTPVLVGFGPLGQAVLRAIVRGPGASPQARRVVVVSSGPGSAILAEAARLDAATRGWDVRHGAESDGDGPVYVCLTDEDEAVTNGLRLGRGDDRDVVVCLQRASPFREALDAAARLKIFGVLDEACREDAIEGDSIVSRAARAIHENYLAAEAARGATAATNPSMVAWADLPGGLQESNFAQAEDIGAKLSTIGASLTTRLPAVPFAFDEREVEQLARLEHVRWMRERHGRGVRYGPRREGSRHPDMRDWPDLSQESRQKDVDAIRQLPELLAAEGLYIRRDPAR